MPCAQARRKGVRGAGVPLEGRLGTSLANQVLGQLIQISGRDARLRDLTDPTQNTGHQFIARPEFIDFPG